MSAVATLLEDKRTSNAANLTASIYEYTALISCVANCFTGIGTGRFVRP
jgi:hypothetical protein